MTHNTPAPVADKALAERLARMATSPRDSGLFDLVLTDAYRSGQLLTLADHERTVQAAVAKAVEAEREACAAIIDSNMLCEARDGSEVLHPRTNPGNKTGVAYAAAIRSRAVAG